MNATHRGGAWIFRPCESENGWAWPSLSHSQWSNMLVLEMFHRRLVVSWYTQKELTPEEIERDSQDNWQYWEEWRKEQEVKADLEKKHD